MLHVVLFFYIITFAVGFGAIVLFFLFSIKLSNGMLWKYTAFIAIFTSYVILNLVSFYCREYFFITDKILYYILALLFFTLYVLLFLLIPTFLSDLLNLNGKRISIVFKVVSAIIVLALILIGIFIPDLDRKYFITKITLFYVMNPIFILSTLFVMTLTIAKRNRINNPIIRKAMRFTVILTLCFIPFFVLDFFHVQLQAKYQIIPKGFFFLVLYYLIRNILSIIFIYRFFQEEFREPPLTKIPEKMLKEISLTKRECEIAVLYANYHTRQNIAEELFITGETVKMHLSHIYEKAQVGSKQELIKKIRSYL